MGQEICSEEVSEDDESKIDEEERSHALETESHAEVSPIEAIATVDVLHKTTEWSEGG